MGKIKLDDNYFITNDSNQWTLNYESEGDINPKTNKPTISTNRWYCTDLKQCIKRYVDESLKVAESVKDLQILLTNSMIRIEKLF